MYECSPCFFCLSCRFGADFPSQRLLKGFSKASQRLSITAASLLHHRCLHGRSSGDEREKGGRRAGEKRITFWKMKFEKYAEQHNLRQRQKIRFGQLFLKTKNLKHNKSMCYYFVLDNFWNFPKKKFSKLGNFFAKMFGGFIPNSYLCIDFRAEIIKASHNRQKHT